MIPKIIHYCWYGNKELPELATHCIESWKRFCPEYKIMRWDETNTNLNENDYIKEAYENKKWAFITDYVRLKALYEVGGVYMDTDVELVDTLDLFLKHEAFSGFENDIQIPTGIMAAQKGHPFFKQLIAYYEGRHFIRENGTVDTTTNVQIITDMALQKGFRPNNTFQTVCGMTFYPRDYFCPKDHATGLINRTENTVCIHHFDGSWHSKDEKIMIEREQWFVRTFGGVIGDMFFKVYKNLFHPKNIIEKIKRLNDN